MSTLALVEELERRDAAAAAALAEVESVAAEVEQLRRQASDLDSFLTEAPRERRLRASAVAEAEARLDRAHGELARAEQQLARARDRGRSREVGEAERLETEAQDTVRLAGAELELARSAAEALDRRIGEAEREAGRPADESASVAERLGRLPRLAPEARATPGSGLDAVATWAAHARGALLVVRGSLAAERDDLVREAHELGAALLGGGLQAASIAHVRELLAEALAKPGG